jgi:hypothetical protein
MGAARPATERILHFVISFRVQALHLEGVQEALSFPRRSPGALPQA